MENTIHELNDLKYDILDIKKKLHSVTSENQLLKVQIRKLQTELDKKNKHIDTLLDPKKSACVQKILTERGATLIIDLKQRNSELVQEIETKDIVIKKMQLDLQTSKTYLPSDLYNKNYTCKNKILRNKGNHVDIRNSFITQSLSTTPSETQITEHLKQNIRKIKSVNGSISPYQKRPNSNISTNSSCNSEKTSLNSINNSYQTENLDKLLKEMENMKEIIKKLSLEQESTKKLIKDKNRSIDFLARQVKHLQRNKKESKNGNTVLLHITSDKPENLENKANLRYSQESFEEDISEDKINDDSKNTSLDNKTNESNETEDDDDVETGD